MKESNSVVKFTVDTFIFSHYKYNLGSFRTQIGFNTIKHLFLKKQGLNHIDTKV